MVRSVLRKLLGSANDRVVKKYDKIAKKIGLLEPKFLNLSDQDLKENTQIFKKRLAAGESLDDILPEAFATVREAAKRTLGMRPFDVQLIGGLVLHNSMIAEMKTGEGKTLMATLPVYLNALTGKGVHVVTVNDYLAKRDADWMGKIYQFLGMTVDCIVHGLSDNQRRKAYAADITYGTNHEFGFDFLRDNMKFKMDELVMRPFNYAIVDEVDSILIDEARTPLIISGPTDDSSDLYQKINQVIPQLEEGDYEKDEKQRSVTLTEAGVEKIESILFAKELIKGSSLYDIQNIAVVHHVNSALKANILYTRDVDYIVKNRQVILIDEFTGRMMEGRRLSEGLHQALEAKEGVPVEMENQTLASITYQNFFRLYPKLAGMAGTAITEAEEFEEIYKLRPIEVPPNVKVARIDDNDEIYLTRQEKYDAVLKQIKQCQARNQPVLVGTASIEQSEVLSDLLKKNKINHQVLNARYHEQEALIIAEAGRPGAITLATNMAGRGTDIKLGGNLEMRIASELADLDEGPERDQRIAAIKAEIAADQEKVRQAGGLYVIGTERHESRRVDNQLRGRSGRQGDPGASKFFVSLEDDLMRIFGSERLGAMLVKLGVKQGEAISHSWITKALERAQSKVEARNFDIRKHLLRYDDVNNEQRKIIYEHRRELMLQNDNREMVSHIREEVIEKTVQLYAPAELTHDQWDLKGFHSECSHLFALDLPLEQWVEQDHLSPYEIERRISSQLQEKMQQKEQIYGEDQLRAVEKSLLLRILDHSWKEHLLNLDNLRQGINLRAYAQSNPLNEYKREAFDLFQYMMAKLKNDFIAAISHFELDLPQSNNLNNIINPELDFEQFQEISAANWLKSDDDDRLSDPEEDPNLQAFAPEDKGNLNLNNGARIKRNDNCPCGSNKKYKHCHGSLNGSLNSDS